MSFVYIVVLLTAGIAAGSDSGVLLSFPISENSTVDVDKWTNRLFSIQLSKEERECAAKGQVWFQGNGESACYNLYRQGPCSRKQWLVMEVDLHGDNAYPTCRPRPCAPHYNYDFDTKKCVPAGYCPRRMVFQYSLLGEGRCHCTGFRVLGPSNKCFLLYNQGYCAKGQILAPHYHLHSPFTGVCVRNPCPESHYPLDITPNRTECIHYTTLDCTPEALPLFTSLVDIKVPLCVYSPRNAASVTAVPEDCAVSNQGNCSKTVTLSSEPFDWDYID